MYKFEIVRRLAFFIVFMNSTLFFENTGTRLRAWQKTMPRDAEGPFASCKHGKAKRAKTRTKQANSADIGIFADRLADTRGQQTTPNGSGAGLQDRFLQFWPECMREPGKKHLKMQNR